MTSVRKLGKNYHKAPKFIMQKLLGPYSDVTGIQVIPQMTRATIKFDSSWSNRGTQ